MAPSALWGWLTLHLRMMILTDLNCLIYVIGPPRMLPHPVTCGTPWMDPIGNLQFTRSRGHSWWMFTFLAMLLRSTPSRRLLKLARIYISGKLLRPIFIVPATTYETYSTTEPIAKIEKTRDNLEEIANTRTPVICTYRSGWCALRICCYPTSHWISKLVRAKILPSII